MQRPGRQHDAHEFTLKFLEAVQSSCLRNAGMRPTGAPAQSRRAETSLVHRFFGGYLQSALSCRCGSMGWKSGIVFE